MLAGIPFSEFRIEVFLRHFVFVKIEIMIFQLNDIILFRHRAHPGSLFVGIPGVPVHLVVADGAAGSLRNANPIRLDIVYIVFKHTGDKIRRCLILSLKILMKDADFFLNIMTAFIVQDKIQQQAAVLTAGKRDIDILKMLEDIF